MYAPYPPNATAEQIEAICQANLKLVDAELKLINIASSRRGISKAREIRADEVGKATHELTVENAVTTKRIEAAELAIKLARATREQVAQERLLDREKRRDELRKEQQRLEQELVLNQMKMIQVTEEVD